MEGQQNESLVQRQNCCCLTGHRSLPSDPYQPGRAAAEFAAAHL